MANQAMPQSHQQMVGWIKGYTHRPRVDSIVSEMYTVVYARGQGG